MSFKYYMKSRRNEFALPIIGPVAVFAVSYFTTNIGWVAMPACLGVVAVVVAIKTVELYNRWERYHKAP